jgi:predicted metal-dependent enzyme (double-stranded beta helix superfamily)
MSNLTRREFIAGAASVAAASSCNTQGKAAASTAAARFDLDQFIAEVKQARTEANAQQAVQDVLARAVSQPQSVLLAIGEPAQAGIHQLYRAPDLTILNVVWAPLMILLPHEHRMWASIGIYSGREDNIVWKRIGPRVEAHGAASLSEREVFSLPEDAVHSVTNPIERNTGAIHIYGGDFFATPRNEWDAETLLEQPFDLERARRVFEAAERRFEAGR